jgi:hypothetical protein
VLRAVAAAEAPWDFRALGGHPRYESLGGVREKGLGDGQSLQRAGRPWPGLVAAPGLIPPRRWTSSGGLRRLAEDDWPFHLRRRRGTPEAGKAVIVGESAYGLSS